jgi:hypothetical protein
MSRIREAAAGIENGVNSSVEYGGQEYHVQTQCSARDAPVIESLVFQDGETLVRVTASYEDVAQRLGFNGDDGSHLLELQHADLIRKIRHGMLRDDDADAAGPSGPPEDMTPHLVDSTGAFVPPDQVDPAVTELLQELGVAIDGTRPEPSEPEAPVRRHRRRWVLCIRLPF